MSPQGGLHAFPEPVERLVRELERLPGIGRRTATRLAFHILKDEGGHAQDLAASIREVKDKVACCETCFQLTDVDPCRLCSDHTRDASKILVVEQPGDLMTFEATGMYRGIYHVLTGRIDPLAGVGPDDLTVQSFLDRIDQPGSQCKGGQGRGGHSGFESKPGRGQHNPLSRRVTGAPGCAGHAIGAGAAKRVTAGICQYGDYCRCVAWQTRHGRVRRLNSWKIGLS